MKKIAKFTPQFTSVLVVSLALIACSGSEKDRPPELTANQVSDSLVIELQGVDSLTVFDVLSKAHEVDYVTTAAGVFVREIDAIGGSDDYFWLYSINGEMPQVAADRYLTRTGDTVKWHYRRINK